MGSGTGGGVQGKSPAVACLYCGRLTGEGSSCQACLSSLRELRLLGEDYWMIGRNHLAAPPVNS